MGIWNWANLRKTYYYLKRNGVRNTWSAARERMAQGREEDYHYQEISEAEKERQRKEAENMTVTFSILVPAYRTPEAYLRELVDSVLGQTYPYFELLIGDATEPEDPCVEQVLAHYQDERIRYVPIAENKGISENTNQVLCLATGDYIGLLDHDDVLTPDALYEMACRIQEGKKEGIAYQMLYSDEDKCNEDRSRYYDRNTKEKFNLDLILSNNYICHFLVLERNLFQSLPLRKEYDGAQDYDLVLRVIGHLLKEAEKGQSLETQTAHIPKVLYHWRCHSASTAENPQSKMYAYEAGRKALQDMADRMDWKAKAQPLKHVGFYRLEYGSSLWESRNDLGAVGGKLLARNKILSGRMSAEGEVYYQGLPASYSGYLHRASLTQDAEAVDLRCLRLRPECIPLFEETLQIPYRTTPANLFDPATLPTDADTKTMSLTLCKALHQSGYRILWDPELTHHLP